MEEKNESKNNREPEFSQGNQGSNQHGEGAPQTPPEGESAGVEKFDPTDFKENKLFGVLAYLGILFLIPLLAKKESPYCQFHAKQGLVLFIAGFIAIIPFIGWLLSIVVLVFIVLGIINALSGEKKKLPLIGDLADKINL